MKVIDRLHVCIPAYKELFVIKTLNSLAQCTPPLGKVNISVFVNGSERDESSIRKINEDAFTEIEEWIANYDGHFQVEVFKDFEIPADKHHVDFSRKRLADKALLDLQKEGKEGVMVFLDADCTVNQEYLKEISAFFNETDFKAGALHIEHPVSDARKDRKIIEYELSLRYLVEMKRWTGITAAVLSLGSAMACTSQAYIEKGGMLNVDSSNSTFLEKFARGEQCGKIVKAVVYPSARRSDRVANGTGSMMLNYAEEEFYRLKVAHPRSFEILREFLLQVPGMYQHEVNVNALYPGLQRFMLVNKIKDQLRMFKEVSSSTEEFTNSVYSYFDCQMYLRYLEFMSDEFDDLHIRHAISWLSEYVTGHDPMVNLWSHLQNLRKREVG
ncbi:hypothetical protein [Jiulongibacter sp. NS-SX5]|uniref:hypothetical protein n=1 Tax=Jiulongibacter sp. NS-SX5 TaxID=3463854 RepID=UPI004058696A